MNNNYNFIPPLFMRNFPNQMPIMPVNPTRMAPPVRSLPRISSLFSGARLGSAGANAASSLATTGASKLTFTGILNGASKTLGVINQAIPVFYQVKPIWNNAKTMFRVVKELNTSEPNQKQMNKTTIKNQSTNQKKEQDQKQEKEIKKEEANNNAPTFFV